MKEKTGYPSIDKTHEQEYRFFDKHPIIPNLSFYNTLRLMSSFYRQENALNCINLTVTYDELIKNSAIISKAFKELGIKAGDIVSVAMPNFYQAVAVFLAANRIGAVVTFLNPQSSTEEIEYYLNLFESPLFINYDKTKKYNEDIRKNTKVKQTITLSKSSVGIKEFNTESPYTIGYNDSLSFFDLKLVSDYYKKPFSTTFEGKEDALILFTSGTTGNPKSVVITNKNIIASGIYMKNTGKIEGKHGEKSLICVPFSYPYGFVTSTLMTLLCGREAILAPNISANNIEYFLSKGANYIFGSPALLELIMKNVSSTADLSSIHSFISGGDFLSPANAKKGQIFFSNHNANVNIFNGSGNAENCGASTIAVGSKIKPETVGKILIGSQGIIVEPTTKKELKYGETGILCVSGEHVFKEYYNEEELSKKCKFNYKGKEYFETGTIGFLDEEGYFHLEGRSSRFYIRSDLNKVYCEKVQGVISTIDVVDSCIVVPQPDDNELYVSKAYVVLKEGALPTKEISDYILEKCQHQIIDQRTGKACQLNFYEIPASITFIPSMPRTIADKIDYKLLEEEAKKEYEVKHKNKNLVM